MIKNTAGQTIGAQMINASTGAAFTGAVTVAVTVDAGTQATGSVGSGACTHEGGGYHTYAPAQAETNGDLVAFTFSGTGAIPATVQVYTVAGDAFTRLGAPAGASVSADVAAIKAETATILSDTNDIQTRIPAALVGGRIDANVGAISGDSVAADNLEAAADGTGFNLGGGSVVAASVTGAVGSVTGNVGGNVTGSVGSVATGGITAASIAADAIGASELAADAAAEIASAVRTELTTELGRVDVAVSTRLATAGYTAPLDAAGTRSAVGLATANLDTQLGDLPTNAELATALAAADDAVLALLGTPAGASVSADVAAVKAQTAAIETDTQDVQSRLPAALVGGRIDATVDGTGMEAGAIDAILDETVGDGTLTMRQVLRVLVAGMAGKLSGAATTTVTIRNAADSANVIVATVDADGNRSAVTVTP